MAGVPPTRTDASTAQKVLWVAGASGAAVVGAAVSGSLATATYFARKVLTPDHRRPDDAEILAVDADRVTFAAGPETVVPGRYGLWLDGGAGHARVGDILERYGHADTVVRRLISVDKGELIPGTARWNSYFYWTDPLTSLGLPYRDVAVEGELGPMPAWVLEPRTPNGRWAVLVHGRAARREECLRALPVLLQLGFTCLVVTYRNDPGAPPAPDGRYNLGLSEWRDVESALEYAAAAGATGSGPRRVVHGRRGRPADPQADGDGRLRRERSSSTPPSWTGATCWPTTPGCTTSRRRCATSAPSSWAAGRPAISSASTTRSTSP